MGMSFGSRHGSGGLGQRWVGGGATVDDGARTKKGQKSPFSPQVMLCCWVCSSLLGSKGHPRKPAPSQCPRRSKVPQDTVMVQTPLGDPAALPPHNMMSHTSLPKPAVLSKVRQLGMGHHGEGEEATSPPGLSSSCNAHAWMSLWRCPCEQQSCSDPRAAGPSLSVFPPLPISSRAGQTCCIVLKYPFPLGNQPLQSSGTTGSSNTTSPILLQDTGVQLT